MAADTLTADFVRIVHAGDTDGFLAMFASDGFVDDWGRVFAGPAEIRSWSDAEFIGAHGRMTDIRSSVDGQVVTVVAQWTSDRHIGPSRFALRSDGGRLASLTITAA